MTTVPGNRMDVEQELTARLSELAHAFIADLNAQGRLVETGGAEALRQLREQNRTQHSATEAETGGAEAIEAAAHPAPAASALWEAIT
ncbi:hypothetical protein, partial [Streptomyces carpinensis]